MSAFSVSDWELTDTYSPAAMDIAPATPPVPPRALEDLDEADLLRLLRAELAEIRAEARA